MNEIKKADWEKYIKLGLFAVSLIPVVGYFFLLTQRLAIPFDLEWGEGAGINQIHRIVSGTQLYGAPTLEFAPLVYTPFYYLISRAFEWLVGDVILAGRLVSVLASLGAAGLIFGLVWRETREFFGAWLAGALYLGCFGISDGFYDLVRVDSLYIFILLGTFLILISARRPPALMAAGLGIAAGFYTKQSALIVFFPLLVYLVGTQWKRYWLVLATAGLGLVGPFWLINHRSGGWFFYYLVDLPRQHGYSILAAVDFWLGDLLEPLGIALFIGLAGVLLREKAGSEQKRGSTDGPKSEQNAPRPKSALLSCLLFAVGAIGAAWITRASNGGGANNAMSAFAAIAILFGLGYHQADELIKALGSYTERTQLLLGCLAAIQFLGLIYNPFNFLPAENEIKANQELMQEIAESEKPVLIPYRSHLPILVGKEPQIHAVNLFELTGYFKGDVLPEGRELVGQIQEMICSQEFGMVVLDQPVPWFEPQLAAAYQTRQSGLETGRSPLLSWQGGLEGAYYPRADYDQAACQETIK